MPQFSILMTTKQNPVLVQVHMHLQRNAYATILITLTWTLCLQSLVSASTSLEKQFFKELCATVGKSNILGWRTVRVDETETFRHKKRPTSKTLSETDVYPMQTTCSVQIYQFMRTNIFQTVKENIVWYRSLFEHISYFAAIIHLYTNKTATPEKANVTFAYPKRLVLQYVLK